MTPEEIIAADYRTNHQGREYSAQQAHAVFQQYIQRGGKHLVFGRTMFLITPIDRSTVEFHTINGGTGVDLMNGVNQLLSTLSQHFARAVTYYDNPRINDLLVHSHFQHVAHKIDQGRDRTYELIFDLRGA
jgi:hypothetical protein